MAASAIKSKQKNARMGSSCYAENAASVAVRDGMTGGGEVG